MTSAARGPAAQLAISTSQCFEDGRLLAKGEREAENVAIHSVERPPGGFSYTSRPLDAGGNASIDLRCRHQPATKEMLL